MNAPRVAVLGGTGWLGRHVCAAFARRGQDVVVVARRPAPHVAGHFFAGLDLTVAAPETIHALLRSRGVSVVVNATDAANATDGWARTEEEMTAANVGLVRNVLAAMRALPWPSRVVHVGTIHEYGQGGDAEPASAYVRTKLAGSRAVLAAARSGEVDGVVLRCANMTGPHPSPETFPGKLVRLLLAAVATGRPMEVAVSDSRRDFVDVRDVAGAVLRAADAALTGRALDIGGGGVVDMRTFVRTFVTAAGYPLGMLREEHREVASLGGEGGKADIRPAAELLHWKPQIGLITSLRDMWETAFAEYSRTDAPDESRTAGIRLE
ncbi:NAD(P)-dependent oxidoreductase [Nonomuraea sp. NPDC046570]|uniref:NAD-dependent epimerase/dehydratase family protein n=1 Tax=Nonomuraea sp. NPDC046570 TaxID=3155255 RepID=UPI0033CAA637